MSAWTTKRSSFTPVAHEASVGSKNTEADPCMAERCDPARPPPTVIGAFGRYVLLEVADKRCASIIYHESPRPGYTCQGYAVQTFSPACEPYKGHIYLLRHEPRFGEWPADLIHDGAARDLLAQIYVRTQRHYSCASVSHVYAFNPLSVVSRSIRIACGAEAHAP